MLLLVCWQIAAETRVDPRGVVGKPDTANLAMFSRSGMQRAITSGRGLPTRFLRPLEDGQCCNEENGAVGGADLVMRKAAAHDMPRPSHPVNHSQSLRLHLRLLGTDFGTEGPGTRMRATIAIMTAGAARLTMIRTVVLTVSGLFGKLISGLPKEMGRLFGEIIDKPAPIPAAPLNHHRQRSFSSEC